MSPSSRNGGWRWLAWVTALTPGASTWRVAVAVAVAVAGAVAVAVAAEAGAGGVDGAPQGVVDG